MGKAFYTATPTTWHSAVKKVHFAEIQLFTATGKSHGIESLEIVFNPAIAAWFAIITS
jgi:hypothetical protein